MGLLEEIKEFQDYCVAMYNDQNGIYKIATAEQIVQAVDVYLRKTPLSEVYFDSVDRERVRQIIQPSYQLI